LHQRLKNALEHDFRLLKHFVVPEPNHAKSEPREISGAIELIKRALIVLASVNFDDQPRSHAYEIRDVGSERHLPAESIAAQMAVADEAP